MAFALIFVPLFMAGLAFAIPSNRWRPWLLPVTGLAHLVLTGICLLQPLAEANAVDHDGHWLGLDPPARLVLLLVSLLFAVISFYAVGYLKYRQERSNRIFCLCFQACLSTLTLVVWAQHLGLMWVAIEATALTTAPLIYFNHTPRSIEATWKYMLVGSVGIALALFGSFLLGYSSLHAGLEPSLLYPNLLHNAGQLSKPWLRAAFILMLVGYGTKMGLAPMHTWKPDAYGEAPGVVGALAGDIGFLPTASYCGRLRGDALNLTALLCGNRFGRAMLRPGGVCFDADAARILEMQKRLTALERDATSAIELLWYAPSVLARFENKGVLSTETARQLGLVGPAARASGLCRDARLDHPSGIYRVVHIPAATWTTGDVFARAYIRWQEIQRSIVFIREQLQALPAGPVHNPTHLDRLAPGQLAVALVEGWRGEICHAAITGADGRFTRYKIIDPSFHNWAGLAHAMRGGQISDFPICNKSFNLSYCGHDL